MKLTLALTLLTACSFAQSPAPPTLTVGLVGSQTVYPGAVLNLQITLANSAGWNIAGIGFSSWSAVNSITAGAASTAAQKTLWCGTAGCLLTGFTNPPAGSVAAASNLAYSDGVVLTMTDTVPVTAAVGSIFGAVIPQPVFLVDTSGNAVTATVSGISMPVVVNPVCNTHALADVQAFLGAPSQAALGTLEAYLATIIAGTCQ